MKRFTAAAIAFIIAATPLIGCNKTNKISKKVSSKTAEERQEETFEEAFRSMYDAICTENGAEMCLAYMYPEIVLNQLRSDGRYDSQIRLHNEAQNQTITKFKHKLEITSITGTVKMTDSQLEAASRYFVRESAKEPIFVGLDPRGINITEGYEIHCEIIDQNGNPDTDNNECVVYIENDGWKVIPLSAAGLEEDVPAES